MSGLEEGRQFFATLQLRASIGSKALIGGGKGTLTPVNPRLIIRYSMQLSLTRLRL